MAAHPKLTETVWRMQQSTAPTGRQLTWWWKSNVMGTPILALRVSRSFTLYMLALSSFSMARRLRQFSLSRGKFLHSSRSRG